MGQAINPGWRPRENCSVLTRGYLLIIPPGLPFGSKLPQTFGGAGVSAGG